MSVNYRLPDSSSQFIRMGRHFKNVPLTALFLPGENRLKFVHTADTHLGFHITRSPVSHPEGRRKRSQSIFENFLSVVEYALGTEV